MKYMAIVLLVASILALSGLCIIMCVDILS